MLVVIIFFLKFFFLIVFGIEVFDNLQFVQVFIKYGDEVVKVVLYIC